MNASVILPVFNEAPQILSKSIDSVLAQTTSDFEFLILDDASDRTETLDCLSTYSRRDSRIVLHRTERLGLTRILNFGIAKVTMPLIIRIDSDDWSTPDRFEKQIAILNENPDLGLVGSNVMFHAKDGLELWCSDFPTERGSVLEAFPIDHPFIHSAVCYRTEAVRKIGGYRETLSYCEDYDLFWRLCEKFGGVNLPEVLTHVRFRRSSKSGTTAMEQDLEKAIVVFLAEMRRKDGTDDFEVALQNFSSQLTLLDRSYSCAVRGSDYSLLAGDYYEAIQGYLAAIRRKPFKFIAHAKLLRSLLYVGCPPLRPLLFSKKWEIKLKRWLGALH